MNRLLWGGCFLLSFGFLFEPVWAIMRSGGPSSDLTVETFNEAPWIFLGEVTSAETLHDPMGNGWEARYTQFHILRGFKGPFSDGDEVVLKECSQYRYRNSPHPRHPVCESLYWSAPDSTIGKRYFVVTGPWNPNVDNYQTSMLFPQDAVPYSLSYFLEQLVKTPPLPYTSPPAPHPFIPDPKQSPFTITRIHHYLNESENLKWLTDAALVANLREYLNTASHSIFRGDIVSATLALKAFITALPVPPATTATCRFECSNILVLSAQGLLDQLLTTPDIAITTLKASNEQVLPGGSLSFETTLRNRGGGHATALTLRLRLLGEQTILLGNLPAPSLAMGENQSLTPTVTVPTDAMPGTYRVEGCVDSDHDIGELSKINNCMTVGSVIIESLATQILRVTLSGEGSGTVTSQSNEINCGLDCHEEYRVGTWVTLEAAPAFSSAFVGWEGACSGVGKCQIEIQPQASDITVAAKFIPLRLVSVSSTGSIANKDSYSPVMSADGRFIAFESSASNLVSGDTNDAVDIFVRDMREETTSRLSVTSDGGQAHGNSYSPAISADGRFVAFRSFASDLVPGDTNGFSDIFVRDLKLGTTDRVSVSSNGQEGNKESFQPVISADGRFIAFVSTASNLVPKDTNGISDIFIRDMQKRITSRISVTSDEHEANGNSFSPAISGDGRFVVFRSWASNLVPGNTNGVNDIFVRDFQLGITHLVSVSISGNEGNGASYSPAISSDGRFIAFESGASNLVPEDTNRAIDIFVRDMHKEMTSQILVTSDVGNYRENGGFPKISADGRFVAFTTRGVDVAIWDMKTGMTTLVWGATVHSQTDEDEKYLALSANGSVIVLEATAENTDYPYWVNHIFIANNPLLPIQRGH